MWEVRFIGRWDYLKIVFKIICITLYFNRFYLAPHTVHWLILSVVINYVSVTSWPSTILVTLNPEGWNFNLIIKGSSETSSAFKNEYLYWSILCHFLGTSWLSLHHNYIGLNYLVPTSCNLQRWAYSLCFSPMFFGV
jgi:hypothetical protein